MSDRFVYVTYIRTTPEKLWDALREPEFTRAYWFGNWQESGWKKGASWKLMAPDGSVNASGEVVEIEKPKRLIISWRGEKTPEQKAEGYSRCTYDIEPAGNGTVKLSIEDDGLGVPDDLQHSKGLGVRIMAHRAAMIGGTFSIEPAPTGGTIVACSLPKATSPSHSKSAA